MAQGPLQQGLDAILKRTPAGRLGDLIDNQFDGPYLAPARGDLVESNEETPTRADLSD